MLVYGIYDLRTEECVYVGKTIHAMLFRWGQHISQAHHPNPKCRNGWLQVLLREQGYRNFEPRLLDPAPGEPPFETDEDLRKQEQDRIDELYPKCNMKRAYRDHKCACGFYLQPTHMDRHLDSRCHFVRMKCMKDGVYKFDKSVMMDADERGEFW